MRKQLRVDPTASIGHPMPQDHRVLPSTRNSHAAVNKPQLTSGDIPSTPNINPAKPPTTAPPLVATGPYRYLSIQEACAYLGCHKRTIDRYIEQGRLKAFRLGRTRKFRGDDLDGALVPVKPKPKNPKDKAAMAAFVNKQTKPTAS